MRLFTPTVAECLDQVSKVDRLIWAMETPWLPSIRQLVNLTAPVEYSCESWMILSVESAFRIPEAEAPLPRIPVQPISYDEAEVILK